MFKGLDPTFIHKVLGERRFYYINLNTKHNEKA